MHGIPPFLTKRHVQKTRQYKEGQDSRKGETSARLIMKYLFESSGLVLNNLAGKWKCSQINIFYLEVQIIAQALILPN